jgi:hypothetical protein
MVGLSRGFNNQLESRWKKEIEGVYSYWFPESETTYGLLYVIGNDPSIADTLVRTIEKNYRLLSIQKNIESAKNLMDWSQLFISEAKADDASSITCKSLDENRPFSILEKIFAVSAQQNSFTRLAFQALTACGEATKETISSKFTLPDMPSWEDTKEFFSGMSDTVVKGAKDVSVWIAKNPGKTLKYSTLLVNPSITNPFVVMEIREHSEEIAALVKKYVTQVADYFQDMGLMLSNLGIDEKMVKAGGSLVCGILADYGFDALATALLALVTVELGGAGGVAKAAQLAAKVRSFLLKFKAISKVSEIMLRISKDGKEAIEKGKSTYLELLKNFQKIDSDDLEAIAESDRSQFHEMSKWVLCAIEGQGSQKSAGLFGDGYFSNLFLRSAFGMPTPAQKCKAVSKANTIIVHQIKHVAGRLRKIDKNLEKQLNDAVSKAIGSSDKGYIRRCMEIDGKRIGDKWQRANIDNVINRCFSGGRSVKSVKATSSGKVEILGDSIGITLDVSGAYFTVSSLDPSTGEIPRGLRNSDLSPKNINNIRYRYLSINKNCKEVIPPVEGAVIAKAFSDQRQNKTAYKNIEELSDHLFSHGHFSLGNVPCFK